MKKIILIAFGFFILTSSISAQAVGQMENDTLINYLDINNKKQGKWIKKYDNGNTWYIGYFVNDIPVGEFIRYHRNGKLMAKINHMDNGYSEATLYDTREIKLAEGRYDPDKQRDGVWNIYFDSGNLAIELNYTHGKVNGTMSMYYPSGNTKAIYATYKNGKLEGNYIKYFKGNRIQEEGSCANGLRHGHWKFYNPDGFMTEEGSYVNGQKQGNWIYYELGDVKTTINYIDDIPDNFEGLMKEWDNKLEWAKQNQDKFKKPEDYFDNPLEFFKDNK
jgi:antitoxin component YwqK of YwqJK toxin-antitoxin module